MLMRIKSIRLSHESMSAIRIASGLPRSALEALLRRIRPYELEPGAADAAFGAGIDAIMEGIERHGVAGAKRGFKHAISLMNNVGTTEATRARRCSSWVNTCSTSILALIATLRRILNGTAPRLSRRA